MRSHETLLLRIITFWNLFPLKQSFILACEICFPDSRIGLCNTHLSSSIYRKLSALSGANKIIPGSKLDDICYIWVGASFLNLGTSSGHDETLKTYFIEHAASELDETKMELLKSYLDIYFTTTGIFRMQR